MEGRSHSYRRFFVNVITIVVLTFILSTLLASRNYSASGPIRIERLPSPRSQHPRVDETIRMGSGSTLPLYHRKQPSKENIQRTLEKDNQQPPSPHSHQLRVDETIRMGSDTTSPTLTGGRSATNVTSPSTAVIQGRQPPLTRTGQPTVNITKKTRKYYMGLTCPKDNPRPGKNLPKITIVSFPRAGNGWTRQLIQYATGLYAGSAGWQKLSRRHPNSKAFPATGNDVDNGRVVIIKTHDGPTPELSTEVVLLIRNPYKSFVSDVYRRVLLRGKYSRKQMLDFFKSDGWVNEVNEMVEFWTSTATQWIAESKRILVVSNERLLENTEPELTRILDFIHQPTSEKKIQCAVKTYYPVTSAARFKIDPFTDEMKTMIDSSIEKVNRTLKASNLSTLPTFQPIFDY